MLTSHKLEALEKRASAEKKMFSKDLPVRHFLNYGSVGEGPEHCVGGAIPGLVVLGFVGR